VLGPEQSVTLMESLEPPDGYRLDTAVGTSFTLDLHAFLAVPTAFALNQAVSKDEEGSDETPLSLLEALHAHAGAITIFTDAAHIHLPGTGSRALGLVERSVVPVLAPRGGAFHPKVWALRFVDDDGAHVHRLLVGSRNLTFDRSWDAVVRLDEDDDGGPLPELPGFLTGLAGLGGPHLADDRRAAVLDVAATIADAPFAPPEGFTDVEFRALGLDRAASRWPFPTGTGATLAVSPFLAATTLSRLASSTGSFTVVSRADELDRAYSAAPEATRPPAYELSPDVVDVPESTAELSGLHAKLVVVDLPKAPSRVFIGSANLTQAAFTKNVEALVELSGPRYRVGTAHWMDPDSPSLRSLLKPHTWAPPTEAESDSARLLEEVRGDLARIAVVCTVTEVEGSFHAHYTASLPDLRGAQLQVRPISQRHWTEVTGSRLDLGVPGSIAQLTAFLGVQLTLDDEQVEFALRCEVQGAPEDLEDRLLAQLIASPERLVRYLLMLLTDQQQDRFDPVLQAVGRAVARSANDLGAVPLLETMLRTASRNPERLRGVDRLMDVVRRSDDLRDDELLSLWDNISVVAREVRR